MHIFNDANCPPTHPNKRTFRSWSGCLSANRSFQGSGHNFLWQVKILPQELDTYMVLRDEVTLQHPSKDAPPTSLNWTPTRYSGTRASAQRYPHVPVKDTHTPTSLNWTPTRYHGAGLHCNICPRTPNLSIQDNGPVVNTRFGASDHM
jgi:hypothetical protein